MHTKATLATMTAALRTLNTTVRKVDGEYKVTKREVDMTYSTYYTNDKVDAFRTALHMAWS